MNIWFVTSECAPFSKSGGLADVAFSLPPALRDAGHHVAIITPLYQCVRERFGDSLTKLKEFEVVLGQNKEYCGVWQGERDGVPVWFLDNEILFKRPRLYGYGDDKYRFAYFSKAVVDLLDQDMEFQPDIMHCNDWETAPAVIYLRDAQSWRNDLQRIRAVYTIHNIAYQGQFGANELWDTFALPSGWYDGGLGYEYQGRHDINMMKGAMLMADAVSTVSATYARELHSPMFGAGLEGVVDMVGNKMRGILNGIDMDHYDPMKDKRIPAHFSKDDLSGKAICKEELQKEFALSVRPNCPILCSVARLVEQKGIELIREILPRIMEMGVQLIIFGQGDQYYIDWFKEEVKKYPGQLGFSSDYSEERAARVFAGSDFYLMPSRFEPCGLSQMMAMRYGTIPIVHETGGLKDSVRAYSDFDGIGDGFSFVEYTGQGLYLAINAAVRLYCGNAEMYRKLQNRAMGKDFSWTKSADQYILMYQAIRSSSAAGESITFEEAYEQLVPVYEQIVKEHKAEIPSDYNLVIHFRITGRGAGVFTMEFVDGEMTLRPSYEHNADVTISASLSKLLGVATGKLSANKLIFNGQMKMSGDVVKGFELQNFLTAKQDS